MSGKRVTIPSYRVRQGDRIELSAKAREFIVVRHNLDTIDRRPPALARSRGLGQCCRRARRSRSAEQIDTQVREQLIVELYSK